MIINKKTIAFLLVSSFTLTLNVSAAEDDFDLSILTDLLNDESITTNANTNTYSNETQFERFTEESTIVSNEEEGDEMNSAGNQPINDNNYPDYNNVDLNSAGTNAVANDYVNPNSNNLASNNNQAPQLPQTGPQHFLLFLLSMIMVGVVFYKRKFK